MQSHTILASPSGEFLPLALLGHVQEVSKKGKLLRARRKRWTRRLTSSKPEEEKDGGQYHGSVGAGDARHFCARRMGDSGNAIDLGVKYSEHVSSFPFDQVSSGRDIFVFAGAVISAATDVPYRCLLVRRP